MNPNILKSWRLATLVPIGVMLVAFFMREVWRDDVWALFYSDPSLSFSQTTKRLLNNVHPPFYFYLLHYWREFADGILWSKSLNLVFIALGLIGARRLGREHPTQTDIFLLLCAGSYWLIYFCAEIRPYTLLFVLGVLSVLTLAGLLRAQNHKLKPWIILWVFLGAANGLTHYYALVWIGCAGLGAGLGFLSQARYKAFIMIGLASCLAVAPGLMWALISREYMSFTPSVIPTFGENIIYGLNQVQRGITTKLIGSNPAAALIFILALPTIFKKKNPLDMVLIGSVIGTIIIVFIIHIAVMPMIKERAFMVIMPALLLLTARAINLPDNDGKWPTRLKHALPIVTVIMPLLFVGEYFKDREKIGDVKALLNQSEACKTAPILVYYRQASEYAGFGKFYTAAVLNGYTLIDVTSVKTPPEDTNCPVRALALGLPRGEKAEHAKVRAAFANAGLDLNKLEERRIGKGRNLVYIEIPTQAEP